VLGLISALTLPTVFSNLAESQQRASLKEAISVLSTVIKEGVESGSIIDNPTTRAYVKARLNYDRFQTTKCSSRVSTTFNQSDCFVLGTGATIDIPAVDPRYDFLYIDANGDKPPNQPGQDWMSLNWNYLSVPAYPLGAARHNTHMPRPGELLPSWRGSTYYGTPKGDVELYQELFSK
jgi:hypothetical protein